MDRSNIAYLIKEDYTKDEIGQEIATETKREIYCDIISVDRDEFYQSGQAGFTAEFKLRMFAYDYNEEKLAEFNGKRYRIYRTYFGRNDAIDLYLKSEVGINE